MEETSCTIDGLTSEAQNQLEGLLLGFDQSWTPDRLEAAVADLAHHSLPFQQIALLELVKIDMERHWQAGSRRTAEHYEILFPQFAAGAVAELLVAEYLIRLQLGEAASFEELAARFPALTSRLAQLLQELEQEEGTLPAPTLPETAELVETLPLDSRTAPEFSTGPPEASSEMQKPALAEQSNTIASSPGVVSAAGLAVPSGEPGRYEILALLGEGAMGTVFLARDNDLDREVALKAPLGEGQQPEELLQRFRQEAKAAAKLQHAGICPVHDVIRLSGRDYISMAYVRGQSLKEYLQQRDQPVAVRWAVELIRRIALAMEHAHSRGVIHRDLKPANVMLNEQLEPLVMDFGLACLIPEDEDGDASTVIQEDRLLGTPVYMSPEQLEPAKQLVSGQTDIYSLGIMLYQLLTGELPYRGSFTAVVAQILAQNPRPVVELRPEVDSRLAAICHRMMAGKLEQRYSSMQQVADDLHRWLTDADAAGRKFEGQASAGAPGFPETDRERTCREPSAEQALTSVTPPADTARQPPLRSSRWLWAGVPAVPAILGLMLLIPAPRETTHPTVQHERQQTAADASERSQTPASVSSPPLAIAPFDEQQARQHQQAWAQHLGVPREGSIDLPGGVKLSLVLIPPGEFLMGSPASDTGTERDEHPRHAVRISQPFFLGQYEVTQAQWRAVMGTQPWKGQVNSCEGDAVAATFITWEDATEFCRRLSDGTDQRYRLPTEAEWEYACRAGTETRFHFGETADRMGEHAWFHQNSWFDFLKCAHEVGLKRPNPWNLYDMHGNAWEWVQDWYDPYGYERFASEVAVDPQGPQAGFFRDLRG